MRKNLKFILLIIFTIFIFWFFGKNVNWGEVVSAVRKAKAGYVIFAVFIICLGYWLRAKRWQVLLEPITPTSMKELFATTTVGFAAMFLVGRAGEIVRPMWLPMRDPRVRPSAALISLGLERIFDLAALVVFFAANLLWMQPPAGREDEFDKVRILGILLLIGVAAGFVALYVYMRTSARIINWYGKTSIAKNRLGQIVLSLMEQLATSLEILRDWRELFWLIVWTIALWFAISIPTWAVLLAFDLPLTFTDSLFIMGFAAVSSVVPTPGGAAGAFHAVTARSLMFLSVDEEVAWATAIVMHLVYFAPAIFFGVYYFIHGDISLKRFKSLLSSESAVDELESESPNSTE